MVRPQRHRSSDVGNLSIGFLVSLRLAMRADTPLPHGLRPVASLPGGLGPGLPRPPLLPLGEG